MIARWRSLLLVANKPKRRWQRIIVPHTATLLTGADSTSPTTKNWVHKEHTTSTEY